MVHNHCISDAWILCCSSAVNVHISQAYRKIDFTLVCHNFSLVLVLILLPFHTNLWHDITAAACAVLSRTGFMGNGSKILEMAERFQLRSTNCQPILEDIFAVGYHFHLFGVFLHAILSGDRVKMLHQLSTFSITSCNNVYIISLSKLYMLLPLMLTILDALSMLLPLSVLGSVLLNSVGERRQHW